MANIPFNTKFGISTAGPSLFTDLQISGSLKDAEGNTPFSGAVLAFSSSSITWISGSSLGGGGVVEGTKLNIGTNNTVSGINATVAGGSNQQAAGEGSAILGGTNNNAQAQSTVVVGGGYNSATSQYANVLGGFNNTAGGQYSSILGGQNNTISHDNSFVLGSGITTSATNTTYTQNLSVVGGLELTSTESGLIFPRMTEAQKDALRQEAGTVIYQTDGAEGLYVYKSTGWVQII